MTIRDVKFRIQIGSDWTLGAKCTEADLKKSQICPILGQSDSIWMPNLTTLVNSWSHRQPVHRTTDGHQLEMGIIEIGIIETGIIETGIRGWY